MTSWIWRQVLAAVVAALLAACLSSNAQTRSGSSVTTREGDVAPPFTISGVVLDPSGAVIAGATVILKGNSAPERSQATDATGNFRFEGIGAGDYEIQVQQAGFQPFQTRVKIRDRNSTPLRISLQIAEVREKISVSADDAQGNPNLSSNANQIKMDARTLESLPILGNDVVDVLSRILDPASIATRGPSVIIDGLESSNLKIPASAIQEIRINDNPYSAEFARPGNGRIEIITKSGSSHYHGSLDVAFRDYRLDARNTFATDRPPEQRRLIEGIFSGPINKSTTFLVNVSQNQDDLQSIIYAQGLQGPIRGNFATPQRGTYYSAQATHQMGSNTLSARYNFYDWSNKTQGLDGFNLPEAASSLTAQFHQIYTSYKAVLTRNLVNEFIMRVRKEGAMTDSANPGVPKIVVLDAFTGGGAQVEQRDNDVVVELKDRLSWSHGKHFVKAGVSVPALNRHGSSNRTNFDGTFYFSSLDDYARSRPFAFEQQQGNSHLVFWQKELGLFFQDEMRIRPNFSMSYGVRYDWQSYLSDRNNFAPNLSFAFAPGKDHKTVLRAGAGVFYDVTGPAAIADTLLYNGSRLHQVLMTDPGYPNPLSLGGSFEELPGNVVRFAPALQAPYTIQYSFAIERQLGKSLTWTTSYAGIRGVKLFRSRDINAPPPPFYLTRPDPSIGVLRQIESSGHLESHALQTTVQGKLNRFSGMAIYQFQRAYDDTNGINSFPANNYDLSGEWSRATFNAHHLFYLYGMFSAKKLFNLGLIFSAKSGQPYTITTGRDAYNDGRPTDRPPGVPRNSMQGRGFATVDLRWSRDFFGDGKQPTVTVGLDAFNILNRINYYHPGSVMSSPFFGQFVAAGPARRLQVSFQLKF
jgi:hypothetical protein